MAMEQTWIINVNIVEEHVLVSPPTNDVELLADSGHCVIATSRWGVGCHQRAPLVETCTVQAAELRDAREQTNEPLLS